MWYWHWKMYNEFKNVVDMTWEAWGFVQTHLVTIRAAGIIENHRRRLSKK